ncbi:MAG: lyase family protein, partial [Thermodesulfobacteriota bacterium]
MESSKSKKLWGGRFAEATAASVEAFTESISYDRRLYSYDIAGSKAHATMLGANGLLSREELTVIIDGLTAIETRIVEGKFPFKSELEDIHMNIEKALIDDIGPAGARLHSARSRNDQIALDLRLYLRDQCDRFVELLDGVRRAFVLL